GAGNRAERPDHGFAADHDSALGAASCACRTRSARRTARVVPNPASSHGGSFPPAGWTIGAEGELQIAPTSDPDAAVKTFRSNQPAQADSFYHFYGVDSSGHVLFWVDGSGATVLDAGGSIRWEALKTGA